MGCDPAKTALKGSIKKWFNVWHGLEEDKGTVNCSLCSLYAETDKHGFVYPCCKKCVVFDVTGEYGCHDTPFETWDDLWQIFVAHLNLNMVLFKGKKLSHPLLSVNNKRTFRQIARREFAFLLALLPYEEQDGFLCKLRGEYLRDKKMSFKEWSEKLFRKYFWENQIVKRTK